MITYKINKEKGVVVAFFAQPGLTAKEVWEENLSNMLYKLDTQGRFYNLVEDIVDKVLKERVVVGRAKLMEGDTFDEEVGKKIAREDLSVVTVLLKFKLNSSSLTKFAKNSMQSKLNSRGELPFIFAPITMLSMLSNHLTLTSLKLVKIDML